MVKKYKIAIDGPAGAGKSTVAKIISQKLKFLYLDTGAMYRAITYVILKNNIDVKDEDKIKELLKEIDISYKKNENNEFDIFINGKKVNEKLRTNKIDNNVSIVSAHSIVREFLVAQQRAISENYNVVLDGRDIGTVVFPDADVKFYIDASEEVRARRRLNDAKNKENISLEQIMKEIKERDKLDKTREIGPLCKAKDAIYVDTSKMSIEEVVDFMISKINKKLNL